MDKEAKQKAAKKLSEDSRNRGQEGKKVAFTLAEVLITLGIIGVVAAVTMPVLINNYQKKVTATRAKQAYSQILQAIQLSEVDNGEFASWDFALSANNKENTELFMQKYLEPYFKGMTECKANSEGVRNCGAAITSSDKRYYLTNGVSIAFAIGGNNMAVLFRVNKKGIMGKSDFYFDTKLGKLMPYGWIEGIKREDILNGYSFDGNTVECKKSKTDLNNSHELNRHGCTALLMLDGWEMKKDYPY